MSDVNCTLSARERGLLAALAGSRLSRIDGYRMDVFDGWVLHHAARVVLSDGVALDLRNDFEALRLPDGRTEDAGVLSVGPSEGGIWLPEGASVARLPVRETIRRVAVVGDTDEIAHGGTPIATIASTQAVAFELGSGLLVLDKGEWTDGYVHVRRGRSLRPLVTGCSEPWVEADGWADTYRRTVDWL